MDVARAHLEDTAVSRPVVPDLLDHALERRRVQVRAPVFGGDRVGNLLGRRVPGGDPVDLGLHELLERAGHAVGREDVAVDGVKLEAAAGDSAALVDLVHGEPGAVQHLEPVGGSEPAQGQGRAEDDGALLDTVRRPLARRSRRAHDPVHKPDRERCEAATAARKRQAKQPQLHGNARGARAARLVELGEDPLDVGGHRPRAGRQA